MRGAGMSEREPEILPVMDDPPKGGYWAPEVSEIEPTFEEIAAGLALGARIDIDDETDNGGI